MIIAITGLAGSGKSTVAKLVGPRVEVAFAEPIKRFCGEVFGFTHEELYGPSAARERPSTVYRRPNGEPLTPRFALQLLGTEWGRMCDLDVWAKAGVARALRHQHDLDTDESTDCLARHVVITDLRFVNEARLVRAAGGHVWRIERAGQPRPGPEAHPSERDVWSDDMAPLVSAEVRNAGTLDDLGLTVRRLLPGI